MPKKYTILSTDENAGTVVFTSSDLANPIEDGRRMYAKINGQRYSATFKDGQAWIFTEKPFGSTYSISHT